MLQRIRFAMSNSVPDPLKGEVKVDETYVGGKPRYKGQSKTGRGTRKTQVVAMVERQGRVKTTVNAKNLTKQTLGEIVLNNVDRSAKLITDNYNPYKGLGKHFAGGHHTVNHSRKEYVRGDIHTNTIEGYFSILKRGIYGVYQHVSEAHLKRYLCEFDFRYSNRVRLGIDDVTRTDLAIVGAKGKRLTYETTRSTGRAAKPA